MPSSFLKQLGCWIGVHAGEWKTVSSYTVMPFEPGKKRYSILTKIRDCTRCGKVKYRLERIF